MSASDRSCFHSAYIEESRHLIGGIEALLRPMIQGERSAGNAEALYRGFTALSASAVMFGFEPIQPLAETVLGLIRRLNLKDGEYSDEIPPPRARFMLESLQLIREYVNSEMDEAELSGKMFELYARIPSGPVEIPE